MNTLHAIWLFPLRMALCAMLVISTYMMWLVLPLIHRLLPVDRRRVRDEWSGRKVALDTSAGLHRLIDLQRIAAETGARIFPISGTLLGLEREGAPLAHDTDVDVGLFADDPHHGDFISAVRNNPMTVQTEVVRFNLVARLLNPWIPKLPGNAVLYKFKLVDPNDPSVTTVRMDVFIHFRALGFDVHGGGNRLWINTPIALVSRMVSGVPMLLPRSPDTYLTENYGDYRTERKDFESATDCPNVVNIYRPSAVIWLIHKTRVYLRAGWDERLRLLDEQRRDFTRHLLLGPSRTPAWRIRPTVQPTTSAARADRTPRIAVTVGQD